MLRLRRKRDIERAFQEGRRFYSPSAVLHARLRHPQEELASAPRLAIVAGRRFRSAVVRNRARRVLRETCRLALANTEAPWDLLLVARPQVLTLPPPGRLRAVTELLRQAGILAEKAVVRV